MVTIPCKTQFLLFLLGETRLSIPTVSLANYIAMFKIPDSSKCSIRILLTYDFYRCSLVILVCTIFKSPLFVYFISKWFHTLCALNILFSLRYYNVFVFVTMHGIFYFNLEPSVSVLRVFTVCSLAHTNLFVSLHNYWSRFFFLFEI